MKIGVICNPVAGGGRLGRERPAIEAAIERHFGSFEFALTEASGDGALLARAMALRGMDLAIAAGGDGTAGEVADGLLQARSEGGRLCELAILPCGTGTDFARRLGMPRDFASAIARIADASARPVDAGRICYVDDAGALASRHFINIASLGISGATARAVDRDKRKGRVAAKALFFWHTVAEFLRYRFQDVRISVDDGAPFEARVALVAVANGRFFGGGMMIAPDAALDDGMFDIVVLKAASKVRLILDMRLVYGGHHRNHKAVTIVRGRKVTVEPVGDPLAEGALVEIDGEPPGRIPATFEILPGALMLRW